jgi:hypothetical protein
MVTLLLSEGEKRQHYPYREEMNYFSLHLFYALVH